MFDTKRTGLLIVAVALAVTGVPGCGASGPIGDGRRAVAPGSAATGTPSAEPTTTQDTKTPEEWASTVEPETRTTTPAAAPAPATKGGKSPAMPKRKTKAAQPTTGALAVTFADVTSSRPLSRTLITMGGQSFRPRTGGKSDRRVLSPVPIGKSVVLTVYPDGRSGTRISAPIGIAAVSGTGSIENTVTVVVSDTSVMVNGVAPGRRVRTYPRF